MLARAFEALAREDYEIILLTYDPGVEITIIGDKGMAVGFAEHYHGHQGYREWTRRATPIPSSRSASTPTRCAATRRRRTG